MEHLQLKMEERRADVMWYNVTPMSDADLLSDVNADEVTRLAPALVFLSVIFVTGIPGNGLVCYAYRTRYSMSSSRWFIYFLGVVDLVMCVVIVPGEVATTFMQYTFSSALLCKVVTFCDTWSLLTLGLTLLIVSIDRYRKVCKPLGWQINFDKARMLCIGAVIIAFVISSPVLAIYGIYNFALPGYSVTARECSFRSAAEKSSLVMLYMLFGILVFVVCLITICTLYVFIWREIKNHIKRERLKRHISLSASMAIRHNIIEPVYPNASQPQNSDKQPLNIDKRQLKFTSYPHKNDVRLCADLAKVRQSIELDEDLTDSGRSVVNLSDEGIQKQTAMAICNDSSCPSNDTECVETTLTAENSTNNQSDEETCEFERPPKQARIQSEHKMGRSKTTRVRRARTRKATFSMFLISIAFVLSYLPFLCLLLARSAVNGFDESMSDAGRATYKFFLRSYFLNCAINPFIYGVSDSRFRQNCKDVVQWLSSYLRSLPRKLFNS